MWRLKVLLISLTMAVLLSGCATAFVQQAEQSSQPLLERWQLKGKVATQGLGAALIEWMQTSQRSNIRISGPLGIGTAKLAYSADGLVIESDGQAISPSDVVVWRELYGFTAPFDALGAWVQGQPYSGASFKRIADDVFIQYGWQVEVRKWQTIGCYSLPSRLSMTDGNNTIKLGGLKWQVAAPEVNPSLFVSQQPMECKA